MESLPSVPAAVVTMVCLKLRLLLREVVVVAAAFEVVAAAVEVVVAATVEVVEAATVEVVEAAAVEVVVPEAVVDVVVPEAAVDVVVEVEVSVVDAGQVPSHTHSLSL